MWQFAFASMRHCEWAKTYRPPRTSRVIRALEARGIDLAPWITHRAPPAEIVGEFPRWLDPRNQVVKAILELWRCSALDERDGENGRHTPPFDRQWKRDKEEPAGRDGLQVDEILDDDDGS